MLKEHFVGAAQAAIPADWSWRCLHVAAMQTTRLLGAAQAAIPTDWSR
jgi:hypothetical protein